MTETNESKPLNDTQPRKKSISGRLALVVIGLAIGASVILPRFRSPARHEVQGTITHVDLAGGRAAIEYIDPANGATREVTGEVPASCSITIDGVPATLADLRTGDRVTARALIDRRKNRNAGQSRVVAEEIHVTRGHGTD